MCSIALSEEHSHLVNMESRNLVCSCRACYLLFTAEAAAQGRYRAVPDRYLHDSGFGSRNRLGTPSRFRCGSRSSFTIH